MINKIDITRLLLDHADYHINYPDKIPDKEYNEINYPGAILDKEYNEVRYPGAIPDKEFNKVSYPGAIPGTDYNEINYPGAIPDKDYNKINYPGTISGKDYNKINYPGAIPLLFNRKTAPNIKFGRMPRIKSFNEFTDKGTRLYKRDHLGRWYFMPVTFIVDKKEIEFPYAAMNITGKKFIVDTQIVGRKGSVKELIHVDDYNISISGLIQSTDGTYPEYEIRKVQELFEYNNSVQLKSALTDLIFEEDDSVVIKSISYPTTPGLEDGQVVSIECVTDRPLELIIQ